MDLDRRDVLAILAMVVAAVLWSLKLLYDWKQKQRKQIGWQLRAVVREFTTTEPVRSRLSVLFDGQQVDNLTFVLIRIANVGNLAITKNDYDQPIAIEFPEGAIVLDSAITEKLPDYMPFFISAEPQRIMLSPYTLNPNSAVTIAARVSRYTTAPRVIGLVIGADIKELPAKNMPDDYVPIILWKKKSYRTAQILGLLCLLNGIWLIISAGLLLSDIVAGLMMVALGWQLTRIGRLL